jgi:hypothetical protein
LIHINYLILIKIYYIGVCGDNGNGTSFEYFCNSVNYYTESSDCNGTVESYPVPLVTTCVVDTDDGYYSGETFHGQFKKTECLETVNPSPSSSPISPSPSAVSPSLGIY